MICDNEMSFYYNQGINGRFRYYRCPGCGLVSLDYMTESNQKKYERPSARIERSMKDKLKTYSFIENHIPARGRMLDIGCGGGRLLQIARDDGWIVKGIDISPHFADNVRATHNIDAVAGDFLSYEFNGEIFDLVIMRHVLEHLADPIAAMKKVHSLLAPGGYGLFEFPNINSPGLRFKRWLIKNGVLRKRYHPDYTPGHRHEFSRQSFYRLAESTGFDILAWETYSSDSVWNELFTRIPVGNKARTLIRLSVHSPSFNP